EQAAQERALADAVAAEQRVDRPASDGQRDRVEDQPAAVANREAAHVHDRLGGDPCRRIRCRFRHRPVSAHFRPPLSSPSGHAAFSTVAASLRLAPRFEASEAYRSAPSRSVRLRSAAGIEGGRSATNVPSPRRVSSTPASTRRWYAFAAVLGLMRSARARSRTDGIAAPGARAPAATSCRTPSSIWLQIGTGSAGLTRMRAGGRGLICINVLVQWYGVKPEAARGMGSPAWASDYPWAHRPLVAALPGASRGQLCRPAEPRMLGSRR